jgi:hypothetical protein
MVIFELLCQDDRDAVLNSKGNTKMSTNDKSTASVFSSKTTDTEPQKQQKKTEDVENNAVGPLTPCGSLNLT